MKAVTWQGRRDVRVEDVADPAIEEPTDAMIRTPRAACAARTCTSTRPWAVHGRGRRAGPRADGHRRGGRHRDRRPEGRGPGRRTLRNLLRLLLDVRPRAVHHERDHEVREQAREPDSSASAVVREVPGAQAGPPGATGRVMPIKVPQARSTSASCPLRRAANRLGVRGVRRRARRRYLLVLGSARRATWAPGSPGTRASAWSPSTWSPSGSSGARGRGAEVSTLGRSTTSPRRCAHAPPAAAPTRSSTRWAWRRTVTEWRRWSADLQRAAQEAERAPDEPVRPGPDVGDAHRHRRRTPRRDGPVIGVYAVRTTRCRS